ncbi:HAD hydrolase-like protein [Agrilutibacter solisilvae]|uniref:HAD hydrolase-like protein n=1 Tax=Agrilutibacter solisilvae TaxID=2763317 RepID=A0A975ATA1_9GAMM|nr:HAD hydrolase-like protein [Lysobacter solisilvae]QSX78894.1 HAD hydrolase-like protein [Lysobacter solisilvae]
MKYPLVIFDFDGTLADSFPFFLQAQQVLAQRHGFTAVAEDRIEDLRRLGPREIMRELAVPAWKLPVVAADFIRAMREAPPVPLFPGIADTLLHLREREVRLAILTSNSVDNVRRVLGDTLMAAIELIDGGAHMLGKQRRIARLVRRAAASGTPAAATDAIYVGDQLSDGEAARAAGVAFGAVGWGYAHADALRAAQPEEFFETVEQLRRFGGA